MRGGLDRQIQTKGRSRLKGVSKKEETAGGDPQEVVSMRSTVLAVRMGPKEVLAAKEESREVLATRMNLREVLVAKRIC